MRELPRLRNGAFRGLANQKKPRRSGAGNAKKMVLSARLASSVRTNLMVGSYHALKIAIYFAAVLNV